LTRTAARILVDQLLVHGVDTAYCVPGESYLGVLDAIGDSPIRLCTTRHEAAAANMAEAYGKLTGRPGVCLVTRAPGATHAAVGIHTAYQDSTPLVLFVGQVPRPHLGREAFQELDYTRMFGEMAKSVTTLEDAMETPDVVERAFHTASSGRPGPVVVALPEDVQDDLADVPDVALEPDGVSETEVFAAARGEPDRGALVRQGSCDRGTDPAARAGDERDLAVELHVCSSTPRMAGYSARKRA